MMKLVLKHILAVVVAGTCSVQAGAQMVDKVTDPVEWIKAKPL
jgi:hypothetical protein